MSRVNRRARAPVRRALSLLAAVAALPALALFGSCSLECRESPPYIVGKPRCVIGEKSGCYLVAGIEFDFYNTDDRELRSLSVAALVYDRETRDNPLIGSNRIAATLTDSLPGGSKAALAIALDPYLCEIPAAPYIVDFFTVTRVEYADGTSWTDPFGLYHAGSE